MSVVSLKFISNNAFCKFLFNSISVNFIFFSFLSLKELLLNIPQINTSLVFGIKNLLNVKSINSVIDDAPHSSYNNLISWGRTLFIEIKINLINQ